ncbi:MAG: glutamine-hydrolyzing carbamoyl-phosphate synthase small subunit [Gammaproteobacteria bacterium]
MRESALLALADGTVYEGTSIGATGEAVGEVVFNTAMTGYQEILTDPSYAQQIVTLTYPHIGNTGTNIVDEESNAVHAAGLVVRDSALITSNWRSKSSLREYLVDNNIVAIAEIDTRSLTSRLREKGAQGGAIVAGPNPNSEKAVALASSFSGLSGADLAQVVTTPHSYDWSDGVWAIQTDSHQTPKELPFKVVAYDFGVKRNILRLLADRGCEIHVVPAKTPAEDVIKLHPDGVFLSNGPGDPEPCDYAINAIKQILETGIPIFGICLGHQLLALACGAQTRKMKFGHHGANHPVAELATGEVLITSQNHGFSVDENSLPDCLELTHRSLFDQTVQGISHKHLPAYGFQGHPEASPGPHDVQPLFDKFIENIKRHQAARD